MLPVWSATWTPPGLDLYKNIGRYMLLWKQIGLSWRPLSACRGLGSGISPEVASTRETQLTLIVTYRRVYKIIIMVIIYPEPMRVSGQYLARG